MNDVDFLKLAIEQSKISFQEGNFPAGAVVVKDGKVISSSTSSPFPSLLHAEIKGVIHAYENHQDLHGATLYASMEPCCMCFSSLYWA